MEAPIEYKTVTVCSPPGTSPLQGECLCSSDWLYACENCYRWWSAVALEALASSTDEASASQLSGQRDASLAEALQQTA